MLSASPSYTTAASGTPGASEESLVRMRKLANISGFKAASVGQFGAHRQCDAYWDRPGGHIGDARLEGSLRIREHPHFHRLSQMYLPRIGFAHVGEQPYAGGIRDGEYRRAGSGLQKLARPHLAIYHHAGNGRDDSRRGAHGVRRFERIDLRVRRRGSSAGCAPSSAPSRPRSNPPEPTANPAGCRPWHRTVHACASR
jgi:hypothetical protein